MSKMAHFDGSSYLSFSDADFAVPENASFKIQYDIIAEPDPNYQCPVCPTLLWTSDDVENVGMFFSTTAQETVRDGTLHTLEFERASGMGDQTVKVDGVVKATDPEQGASLLKEYFGTIGNATPTWVGILGSNIFFTGYISNLKIYINDVLMLDMPMTEDLLDHSANAYEITNVGVTLVDVGGSVCADGSAIRLEKVSLDVPVLRRTVLLGAGVDYEQAILDEAGGVIQDENNHAIYEE